MTTISARREQIASSLQDKEYRDLFVTEEIDTGVPFQVRAMRQARGWPQKELATRLGMTQEGVSRLENPNYGKLTLTTLKRLASAFDVGLAVHFVPFSRLADRAANLAPEDLAVPDYEHDPGLHREPEADLRAQRDRDGDYLIANNLATFRGKWHEVPLSQAIPAVRVDAKPLAHDPVGRGLSLAADVASLRVVG